MKLETSNRLASWLRKEGRDDLANQGEVDVPDLRYLEVFAEAKLQHPEEDFAMLRDRTLFRCLTHPEWAPTRKQAARMTAEKRDRWLRYAWAIAVLLLLMLIAVRGHGQDFFVQPAHGQEKPLDRARRIIREGQGSERIQTVAGVSNPASPPPLTADQKVRILVLQHKYDDLRVQAVKLEMDKMKLERQISDVLSSINGLAFDIARESKVPTDNWNLNIDSLVWEKRK